MDKEYPKKLYCSKCKKETKHISKMDALKNGCLVCVVCYKENKIKPKTR